MKENGCRELYDGDSIFIAEYGETFTVKYMSLNNLDIFLMFRQYQLYCS